MKNLEFLIVTHFDTDHAGGAADLINKMDIGKIYVNSTSDTSKTALKIYQASEERNFDLAIAPDDGIVYSEPGLTVRTFVKNFENDNESSVMALLSYKDFDILFTGDAGVEAFNRISAKLPKKVEVLKVGHHGAKNVVDENYIKIISPDVSIISTGLNNYGHPAKSSLNILRNTEIYRTDKNNAVKISTDGKEYKMFTFNTTSKKFEPVTTKVAEP